MCGQAQGLAGLMTWFRHGCKFELMISLALSLKFSTCIGVVKGMGSGWETFVCLTTVGHVMLILLIFWLAGWDNPH